MSVPTTTARNVTKTKQNKRKELDFANFLLSQERRNIFPIFFFGGGGGGD